MQEKNVYDGAGTLIKLRASTVVQMPVFKFLRPPLVEPHLHIARSMLPPEVRPPQQAALSTFTPHTSSFSTLPQLIRALTAGPA